MARQKAAGEVNLGCCPQITEILEPRFFKALCDPNRIALLARLAECGKPCSVTEMSACCPVNISVVSRHLSILKDAGILAAERRGKEVYYSVCCPEIVSRLRNLASALEACCCTTSTKTKTKGARK